MHSIATHEKNKHPAICQISLWKYENVFIWDACWTLCEHDVLVMYGWYLSPLLCPKTVPSTLPSSEPISLQATLMLSSHLFPVHKSGHFLSFPMKLQKWYPVFIVVLDSLTIYANSKYRNVDTCSWSVDTEW
jgi:hypothetical protein